ncbi:peptidyl-alpha-hydroxyglycine alpha-amidating lyase family protein [Bacillus sp. CGMCC 1.16541]|uniref:peptidyl-alpha-hydroxyglycine alpha-amidating lyase family protein n=1 Tax=Bacillus sp. CGMCC 1.16541 TaxID=2185143 RepID=UPI001EF3FF55|nr:peptidyl-alpha-hydroxyglycine alpha-amidating lyase family protein [Bacillus sp. CGMCC 1.16541]
MNVFKKGIVVVIVVITGVVLWGMSGGSDVIYKEKTQPIETSPNYEASIMWPKTPLDKKEAGEASGVAVNSKGDVYYLHRSTGQYGGDELIQEPTVVVIDGQTEKVKAKWGQNVFQSPHGLEIDDENNVWITDVSLNKVFKFDSDGQLLATFGDNYSFATEALLRIRNVMPDFPTFMSESTFARPTDVTVLTDGSFVVSDGYRNRRIAKFTKDGQFLWEVNELGSKEGEFHLPHGISRDHEDNLYIADRSNARIQVFNKDGQFQASWEQPELGRPFGVEVGEEQNVYVVDGGDSLYPDAKEKKTSQIVVLNRNGTIIERFGQWGTDVGAVKVPHDIAVDQQGNVYVAELENERLQKFKRK